MIKLKGSTFFDYLRLIRFPNLLIVALTQYLLQYTLLAPAFKANGLDCALDFFHFSLLVISTMLIAAAGYVINDLIDYPIDQVNKPGKVIIKERIPLRRAWQFYYGIIISGFLISLYLAWHVQNIPLVLIYPAAVGLLHWYSTKLKATVLWGNLAVSLFCAFVPGIVLFAERFTVNELFLMDFGYAYETVSLFLGYLSFAFLSTLVREIIKDMEDVFGDRQLDYRTLPIVWGISRAKVIAFLIGTLLLGMLLYGGYIMWQRNWWPLIFFLFFTIILPLVYVLLTLRSAQTKQDFHALSQFCKYIMLSGLLGLFLLSWGAA